MNAWINLKFEHIIFIVYLVIESYLEKKRFISFGCYWDFNNILQTPYYYLHVEVESKLDLS